MRDQCAHWLWQSPNFSDRYRRRNPHFANFSEEPGDCHVASLLAMTALSERFKQQFTSAPQSSSPGENAEFERLLKRRDEAVTPFFIGRKSRKAMQGYILVWKYRKTERIYEKNTRIEVRTFQRIPKDTNKLELSFEHKLLKVSFVMIFY